VLTVKRPHNPVLLLATLASFIALPNPSLLVRGIFALPLLTSRVVQMLGVVLNIP
jgi:hypothetical protein